MRQWRRLGVVLMAVLFCALLGGLYGQRVEATTQADDSDVQSAFRAFTRVYEAVEQNYADRVDPNRAIFGPTESGLGAIPGMLRTLDPHSNFFDPRAFNNLREQMEGRYYGVGMRIQSWPGRWGGWVTIVAEPIPGSPAFRAGLRPGDVISAVDGQSTKDMNGNQVADRLKGPKGTVVHITVTREGYSEPLQFTVTRDEISPQSVDAAFMIRPGIAYIHLNTFNETTDEELTEALRKLDVNNLRGLILDLRGNGGGLLNQAVDVSDHFLEKHQLIVYHNGRHSPEKRYYVQHGDHGHEYPMVVLIDRQTASAAEIVTGALQDHDRALVMGEPSFGKGLVQSEFPLPEHTMLLLTTAHYYTPSGRLIQRDYSNVTLWDYYNRSDSAPPPKGEVRLTDGGREVYGGGGITPDVLVPVDKANPTQEKLAATFFPFAKYYLGVHKTIPRDFQTTEAVLAEYKQFLADKHVSVKDSDFQSNLDYIKNHIRIQLVYMIYGSTEKNRLVAETDPLVIKALASFDQARQLMANAKRYVAEKMAEQKN
jgi:carboxyl-terminal processing protease